MTAAWHYGAGRGILDVNLSMGNARTPVIHMTGSATLPEIRQKHQKKKPQSSDVPVIPSGTRAVGSAHFHFE